MKKFLALTLALLMVLSLAACAKKPGPIEDIDIDITTPSGDLVQTNPQETTAPQQAVKVMSYEEYAAAALDSEVTIEAYVQATQSWWDNKITVYAQDENGGYFLYEMACSEADAAKLLPGTKIRVSGVKAEWSGEVEIVDAKFEILEGNWVAQAQDATAQLISGELLPMQNQLALFKGLTVEKIEYKNGEPGDDIYLTVSKMGQTFDFCVERYLTGPESDVYKTVGTLKVGDCVDIEGFVYWYNGPNPHITAITNLSAKSEGVMTYADYVAAPLQSEVVIEAYVQANQSWWDNKITVYAQDPDGAYFLYEMACSEENAAKLVPGTKIKVTGYKAEWSGEVEITDATFEIIEGMTYEADPLMATDLLGSDELIKHQNELALFEAMTVTKIEYKNGTPGDDIYVTLSKNGTDYEFCVEVYLTGTDSDVYKTVGTLQTGDVVNVAAFIYWYNGPNPHIVLIAKA